MIETMLESPASVVAVFAHPDDAELTCFGTLARLQDRGAKIAVLVATDGESSRNVGLSHDRRDEAHQGQSLLSAQLELLGLPDGHVFPDAATVATVEDAMCRYDPHMIITHYPQARRVGHQDHEAVAEIVTNVALRRHPEASVLYAEPPVLGSQFEPNLFVDVTDYFSGKLRAVASHQSENTKSFMDPRVVEGRAQWWALQALAGVDTPFHRFEAFYLAKGITLLPSTGARTGDLR